MRVLAFVKYDTLSASTRQRFLQYEPYLRRAGIEIEYSALLNNNYLESLVTGRPVARLSIAGSYFRRLQALVVARRYDVLWLHSEFFPYLPGFAERAAALYAGRPIVVDFDDAIFHEYDANSRLIIRRLLGRKLQPLLKQAAACCCGNPYLRSYVARICSNSIILPTVVDTLAYRPAGEADRGGGKLVIGWIGSPSTWKFMYPLLPLLRELIDSHGVSVRVVGAGAKALAQGFPGFEFIEWREATEIQDVQAMNIGIMPLPDELWSRGKSGYKLIQYMACGLPVVASPVGVNSDIVRDGVNGFLAENLDQWKAALVRLVEDPELRARMGAEGRKRAETDYSVQAHAPRLVALLESVASAAGSLPGTKSR